MGPLNAVITSGDEGMEDVIDQAETLAADADDAVIPQ
jgi:hypothetical protein